MAWSSWAPLAGAVLGGGSVLVSVVSSIANRKLIDANAVGVLTKTTADAAEQLAIQLKAERLRNAEAEAYRRDRDELVATHEKWDRLVVRTAERLNITLTDPPPLWPDDDDDGPSNLPHPPAS